MISKKNSKWERIVSSKDYEHLDGKIKTGSSTFLETKKNREAIKENIEKAIPPEQLESIPKFGKVLFRLLKNGLDTSITTNQYLFELIKDAIKTKKLYDGLYKIDVIKKDQKGIVCRINGGNYQTNIIIDNAKIMEKKPAEHKQVTKTYRDEKWESVSKERQGKKEDFLQEIEYRDSVIVDIYQGKVRKINPEDIIDEIKNYIKRNDSDKVKAKKIQTAIKFFNDSRDRMSSEYITEFFKWVSEKQKKRKGKGKWKEEITRADFAEVLKRFINKEKNYVHKGSDIDKSALQFLLKKLWVKDDKIFHEISHSDVDKIDEGLFWDVWWTINGIKNVDKISKWTDGSTPIKKTKTIISEHIDWSDESLLTNRTCSTTHMIFRIAKQLWMIDKEELPQLERFMHFVNTVDSMDYQISSIDYPNNYQTLLGLYRKMDIKDVYEYFKNTNNSGFERLAPSYMENIIIKNENGTITNLNEISKTHHNRIDKNIESFKKIQNEKKEFWFKNTKYIVDLEWEIEDGAQTAWYHGYWYFTIGKERGNIYMYSPKKMPFMVQGYPTDDHFLIINNPAKENIKPIIDNFLCNDEIKASILEKIEEKYRKKNIHSIIEEKTEKLLGAIDEKTLKIGRIHQAIINNITNKIMYVNLDNKGKIRGMIKFESKEEAKKFNRWDMIKVRIDEIKTNEEHPFLILSMAK